MADRGPVLDLRGYLADWSRLHGGYDPADSTVIRAWLTLSYTLGRPFAVLRVPPDLVTLLGAVASGVVVWLSWLGGGWLLAAALVVALSGVLDSLDGAVAVISGRTTRWGYVLDSLVDRVSDTLYLVALWVVGAPGWLCVLGGVLMGLHEYSRARAGNAGMGEIGVITVWERPTRIILTALILLSGAIHESSVQTLVTGGAVAWVVLGAVGLTQLLVVVHRRLSAPQ